MSNRLTSSRAVRAAFWRDCAGLPGVKRRRIRDYSGDGKMYNTDTRCAFTNYVDSLARDGAISDDLAQRVTLD